jgi:hypothetical protein
MLIFSAGSRCEFRCFSRHSVDLRVRWKDTETPLTCYQQPDADTLLAVMSEPKKMRDAALASG